MDREQLVLGTDHETLSLKELMAVCQHMKGAKRQGNVSAQLRQEKAPKPAVLSMLSL